jgi:hypothetical protein
MGGRKGGFVWRLLNESRVSHEARAELRDVRVCSASGESSIEVGVLLKRIFGRSTEFVFELSQFLFDTEE